MPTNLAIDDRLIEKARIIGGHKSKISAITEALQEYIQRRQPQEIIKLFGRIEYDVTFDYKKRRNKVTSLS